MLYNMDIENKEVKKFSTKPLIMMVDDSEINNYINSKILHRYEFSDRILVYEDSTLAFEYLQKATDNGNEIPSLIFLDLNMPVMDGRQFVEKYELLPSSVKNFCKIVILTNSANPNDRSKMLSNKNILAYFNPPLIKSNLDQLMDSLKQTGFGGLVYSKTA